MSPSIFVSYRHDDSLSETQFLVKALQAQYGEDEVFSDFTGIQAGDNWTLQYTAALESASIVLVVIGANRFGIDPQSGHRATIDPSEFEYQSLVTALSSSNSTKGGAEDKTIIPLLLDRQPLSADQLPDSLKALAYRQSYSIRRDHLETDIKELLSMLDKQIQLNPKNIELNHPNQ